MRTGDMPVVPQSQLNHVKVEVSVILGRASMPVRDFLRMGRGAEIPLDATDRDEVWILAAGYPIARGEIQIDGERITVVVTGPADVAKFHAAA
jgi:flagellar motor switch protein FliN/FliY